MQFRVNGSHTQVPRDPATPEAKRRDLLVFGSEQSKVRTNNVGSREQTVGQRKRESLNRMPKDIILIGPVRVGKSTVGKLLSERLQLPQVSLDELRWEYYQEIGYDPDLAQKIRETGGFVALVFYWKLFDAYAVERVLADHRGCVFDFGAGHSMYESTEMFERVKKTLAPYPNIILLLPSPDVDESVRILNERTRDLLGSFGQGFNWHEYFLGQEKYYKLAKHIVYTQGKTPEETCDEIMGLVGV
jgi:adenylate kinase family enzyme